MWDKEYIFVGVNKVCVLIGVGIEDVLTGVEEGLVY